MALKKKETYTPLESNPNVFVRESREIAVAYSLQQMKVGMPVEFRQEDIDLKALLSVASRMKKNGFEFVSADPTNDEMQLITRTK